MFEKKLEYSLKIPKSDIFFGLELELRLYDCTINNLPYIC
jgi:hypothetical protein